MWLFTTLGFFSVVCARTGDGSHARSVDSSRVMIRVRLIEHLENLREKFPQLKRYEIIHSPHADYMARMIVPKHEFAPIAAVLVMMVDYDNFKNKVAQVDGFTQYEKSLHSVWSIMHGVQKRPARSSWETPHSHSVRHALDLKKAEKAEGVTAAAPRRGFRDLANVDLPPPPQPGGTMTKVKALLVPMDAEVLVVQARMESGGVLTLCGLIGVDHYRRGYHAARDASALGAFPRMSRKRMRLVRARVEDMGHPEFMLSELFDMAGVVPSVGEPVARPKKWSPDPVRGEPGYAGSSSTTEATMSDKPKPTGRTIGAEIHIKAANATSRPGPLVEDESVVGGTDVDTGAPVIRSKTSDGRADESVNPTDRRESSR